MYAHPGYEALREHAKERMDAQFTTFATRLMGGDPPSAGEVEYARGFFAGMKFLLDKPKLDARKIERELARSVKPNA